MRRTWPLLTVPLAWLFIEAAARLAGFVAGLVGLNVSAISGRWQDNICALFAWGLVLLALWAWLRWYERRSLAEILAGRKGFVAGFVQGAIMVVAIVAMGVAIGGLDITGPGAWFDHLTPTWLFASVLSVCGFCVQAVAKEALFRGWMLRTVAGRWGAGMAVIVNVLAYAGLHGMHFAPSPEALIGIVNLGLMGLILSLVVLRQGTIWKACGLSAAWNLLTTWGFGLNISGEHLNVTPAVLALSPAYDPPGWLTGGGFGLNGTIEMSGVLIITLALMAMRRRKPQPAVVHDEDDYD